MYWQYQYQYLLRTLKLSVAHLLTYAKIDAALLIMVYSVIRNYSAKSELTTWSNIQAGVIQIRIFSTALL